jgi:hypothetical protein
VGFESHRPSYLLANELPVRSAHAARAILRIVAELLEVDLTQCCALEYSGSQVSGCRSEAEQLEHGPLPVIVRHARNASSADR